MRKVQRISIPMSMYGHILAKLLHGASTKVLKCRSKKHENTRLAQNGTAAEVGFYYNFVRLCKRQCGIVDDSLFRAQRSGA